MGSHRHTRIDENKLCDIKNCDKKAERSLPLEKVRAALTEGIKDGVQRRAILCRDHYREYRKKTKTERITDRLGWGMPGE